MTDRAHRFFPVRLRVTHENVPETFVSWCQDCGVLRIGTGAETRYHVPMMLVGEPYYSWPLGSTLVGDRCFCPVEQEK